MAFNFKTLLKIVGAVSKTKSFDLATELAFKKIGKKIDAAAEDPKAVKEIAKELVRGAPDLVVAIKEGTKLEK